MKHMIKKIIFSILVLFLPISELSAYNSTILKIIKQESAKETSINELKSKNYGQEKQTIAFKPFSINEETCELEVGDLDVMLKEIQKQLEKILEDLGSGGEEYLKAKKNQLLKESLTRLPAYVEFMTIKGDPKIIGSIASELANCVTTTTAKGIKNAVGGGGGDQGGEFRIGAKPKELLAIVECYSDAFYPKDMTNEDSKLLKKLEEKWENLINTLLNTQLNLMIKAIQMPASTNICTESVETKSDDLSYLLDSIGSIYLLDNTKLSSTINFEIETEKQYKKRISSTENWLNKEKQIGKGRIKKNEKKTMFLSKEKLSKQPLFTDMEEGPFDFFKTIVKKYMIDLSNTYGIFLNRETKNYVEIILTKLVFEINEKDKDKDKSKFDEDIDDIKDYFSEKSEIGEKNDIYTLIFRLSENMEYFNNIAKYDKDILYRLNLGDMSFNKYSKNVDSQIIRDILNKTLLNAYSRYQKVKANKLSIYYANIPKIFEVNNKQIVQILMVDRYFYRYKKELEEKYIKRIIYKKELEKKQIITDFCIDNGNKQMFKKLCDEVRKK